MAGYSGTPLAKKLGYKAGLVAHVHGAPANYLRMLALDQPGAITWWSKPAPGMQLVHVFTTDLDELRALLKIHRRQLAPDGALWVSWPKKASKVPTDVTEDRIREAALPLGFVDIKVCAVDEVWSGLKLVVRKELR